MKPLILPSRLLYQNFHWRPEYGSTDGKIDIICSTKVFPEIAGPLQWSFPLEMTLRSPPKQLMHHKDRP